MAIRAGTAYVDVRGDFSQLQRGVAAETKRMSSAGSGMGAALSRGLGGAVREIGRTLETGLGVATAAAAGLGGAATKAGLEYNTLGQRATAAMTTVLGSGEKATGMMRELMEFASKSPFPRQAFVEASQQMLAFGFNAKDVIPTLGAVQDAIAASGGSAQQLQEVTFVLSQIQSAGKITGQDLLQLGQRGINAAELIGSSLGKSGEQVKADITAGSLDAGEAIKALTDGMQQQFGGAAANLKGTWVGTTDSIKARIRDLGAAFVQPFVGFTGGGALVRGLNAVNDAVKKMVGVGKDGSAQFKGALEPLNAVASSLAGHVERALKTIAGWIGKIDLRKFEGLSGTFRTLAPAVAAVGAAFGAKLGGSIPILSNFLGGINPLVAAIGALIAASPQLRSQFGELAASVFQQLRPLVPPVLELFQQLAQAVIPLVTKAIGVLVEAAGPMLRTLASAGGSILTALQPAFQAIGRVLESLRPALAAVAGAFVQLAPILGNTLVVAINALAPLLPVVARAFGAIVEALAPVIPPLAEVAQKVVAALVPAFAALKPALVAIAQAFARVAPIVAGVVAALAPLAGKVLVALAPVLVKVAGALAAVITAIPPKVLAGMIAGWLAFKLAFRGSEKVVGGVSRGLGGLGGVIARIPLNAFVIAAAALAPALIAIGGILSSLQPAIAAVANAFAQLPPGLLVAMTVALGGLAGSLLLTKTAVNGLQALASPFQAWTATMSTAGKAAGVLESGMSLLAGRMAAKTAATAADTSAELANTSAKNAGIIATARETVASAAYAVKQTIVAGATKAWAAAQWVLNAAMNANPIGLIIAGAVALAGIAFLVIKNWDKVKAALGAVWDWMKGAAQATVGAVVGFFTSLPGRVWDAIKGIGGFIGRIGRSLADGTRGAVSQAAGFFTQLPGRVWNGIKAILGFGARVARGFMDGLRRLAGQVGSFAAGLPGRVWNGIKSIAGQGARVFAQLWDRAKQTTNDRINWFKSLPGKIAGFLSSLPGKMGKVFSDAFNKGVNMAKIAINWLIDKWNGLGFEKPGWAKDLGLPGPERIGTPKMSKLHAGGLVTRDGIIPFQGFQRGGMVQGRRRPSVRDTVPALLEPGELVIPRGASLAETSARMGAEAMRALNGELAQGYTEAGARTSEFVGQYGVLLGQAAGEARQKAAQIRQQIATITPEVPPAAQPVVRAAPVAAAAPAAPAAGGALAGVQGTAAGTIADLDTLAEKAGQAGTDTAQALQDALAQGYEQTAAVTAQFVSGYGTELQRARTRTDTETTAIRASTVSNFQRMGAETSMHAQQMTRNVTSSYRRLSDAIGAASTQIRQRSVIDFQGMSARSTQLADQQRIQVTQRFVQMQQAAGRSTTQLRDRTVGDFRAAQQGASSQANQLRDNTTRATSQARERITKTVQTTRTNIVQNFTIAQRDSTAQAEKMRFNAVWSTDQMRIKMTRASAGTKTGVVNDFRAMGTGVQGGLRIVERLLNDALGAMGVKKVSFGAVQKKQKGGRLVPGTGSGDKIPALLEPGEVVWNREAVRAIFGSARRANAINRAIPRFQQGGEMGEMPRGVPSAMGALPGLAMLAYILKRKFGLGVTSGKRDTVTTSGRPSDHNWGGAIDVSNGITTPQMDAAAKFLAGAVHQPFRPGIQNGPAPIKQLIYRTTAGGNHFNHIHVALVPAAASNPAAVWNVFSKGAAFAGMGADIDKVELRGDKGPLRDLGQATIDKARAAANQYIADNTPDFGLTGAFDLAGIATGPLQQMAQEMIGRAWSAGEWPAFNWLVNKESSWNPRAVNPSSGAAGLAQALPASKYPPGAWPYSGPESAKRQLAWMIDYIRGRYGTPSAAMAFHRGHNWYQRGGIIDDPNIMWPVALRDVFGQGRQLLHQLDLRSASGGGGARLSLRGPRVPFQTGGIAKAEAKLKRLQKDPRRNAKEINKVKANITQMKNLYAEAQKKKKARDRADWLKKRLRKISNLGVLPKRLALNIAGQTKWAEVRADWAARAKSLTTDPSDEGLEDLPTVEAAKQEYIRRYYAGLGQVFGGTERHWMELRLRSLFNLRNSLIRARELMIAALKKIAAQLAKARKRLHEIDQKYKQGEQNQKAAETTLKNLKEQLKRTSTKTAAGRSQADSLRKRIAQTENRLKEIKDNQRKRVSERGEINKQIIPALQKRQEASVKARGEFMDRLDDVQGLGSPLKRMKQLPQFGVLGGQILATQMALRELVPPAWTGSLATKATDASAGDTGESAEDSERARLLEQLLREANLRAAVAERQFAVLREWPPFGGAFQRGGIIRAAPGGRTIIAGEGGRDEAVIPLPAGWRSNRAGAPERPVVVQVIVEDGAVDTRRIRAIAQGEAQVVTRRQAVAGARMLPGAGGG